MKKAAILILALLLVTAMYGCAKETATTDASIEDMSSDISDIDSIDQTSADTSDLDALEQDLDTQI